MDLKRVRAKLEEGFLAGFLVLAFVVFIFGFLVGMVAIALIPIRSDYTLLGFMLFSLGFVCAIAVIALFIVLIRLREYTQKPSA